MNKKHWGTGLCPLDAPLHKMSVVSFKLTKLRQRVHIKPVGGVIQLLIFHLQVKQRIKEF